MAPDSSAQIVRDGVYRRSLAIIGGASAAAIVLCTAAALVGAFLELSAGPAQAQGTSSSIAMPLLPNSVAFDTAGNLYFSDTDRNVVYESSLAGILSIVAGNYTQGDGGDGGPATSAELNAPEGVAVGPDGTLYIADTGNQRIRAVNGGQIVSFAGNGSVGFSGDGGPAINATFRHPGALAIDASGALLVCDSENQRVRRISGGVIQTIAGNGLQGFSGDGRTATTAELDTPMGLAVGGDGRIFIADAHNHRIRVIATSATISTFAGNGTAGYSGDGGQATAAELSLPRGLFVTPGSAVVFADSNNQRIRMVDSTGIITTIAGTGVQGIAIDGTPADVVAMNSPRGVALSSYGAPVYADALSQLVRESVASGNVYVPAGLAPARTTQISLSASSINGESNAAATVGGTAGTAQGTVELLNQGSLMTEANLVGGSATFAPQSLPAGSQSLYAAYLGDGVNPAATSAPVSVNFGTVVITASANPATVEYGEPVPVLTGTIIGGTQPPPGVVMTFTTSAVLLSPAGSYPIFATLTGSGSANYTLVMSPTSGMLQILPAPTATSEQAVSQDSYTGLPLLLSASVTSTTAGAPTGVVTFLDNGLAVATAMLLNGTATGTFLSPATGTHSFTASYGGDGNFLASVSQPQTATVSAIPDFVMASSGVTTETVAAGNVANFAMTIGPQSGAFTGVVDFSASGLPAGATVSFSPPQVVPGTSTVVVMMSVQTSATLSAVWWKSKLAAGWAATAFPLWLRLRRRRTRTRIKRQWLAQYALLLGMLSIAGCGARTVSTTLLSGKTYIVTVTGTSTNLAGIVVSHSTAVTLVVE